MSDTTLPVIEIDIEEALNYNFVQRLKLLEKIVVALIRVHNPFIPNEQKITIRAPNGNSVDIVITDCNDIILK